jgi:hypothetical protein
MKYYLWPSNTFYTQALLKKLVNKKNELVDNINSADAVLFSACDIMDIKKIERLKRETGKPIIVGGHAAVFYKLWLLFADYVNIGQGFNFFDKSTIDEIKQLKSIVPGENIIFDNYINWEDCPIVEIKKDIYSYFAGVGCKNKCKFCLTSNINKYQKNDIERIRAAEKFSKKNGARNFYAIANENEKEKFGKSGAIILRDYIKIKHPLKGKIRFGIEFATEDNRKKMGKFFTDEQLIEAFNKSFNEKTELFCFCIGGIDKKEDWYNLFEKIPLYKALNPRILFKFTNIQYEMFTPLYQNRFNQNIENYITNKDIKFWDTTFKYQTRFRFLPVCDPAISIYRSGLQAVEDMGEYKALNERLNIYKKDKKILPFFDFVFGNLLKNDYSKNIIFGQ